MAAFDKLRGLDANYTHTADNTTKKIDEETDVVDMDEGIDTPSVKSLEKRSI